MLLYMSNWNNKVANHEQWNSIETSLLVSLFFSPKNDSTNYFPNYPGKKYAVV